MRRPFTIKYNWDDFDNVSALSSYQKYKIKKRCTEEVYNVIQETINQSVEDRAKRRLDLDAHTDAEDPFWLDIGGEG
jgi:hypothetical protein|tara:strand:+ start:1703 stop:1933 length:231 start_codon:yes stop_codon:yes gene_type:complete